MSVLVRDAEVDGARVDVRIAGSTIEHVAAYLAPDVDDVVVDAEGCALIPGLHDHHMHLLALAATASSVDVGPQAVPDAGSFADAIRAATKRDDNSAWIRAIGYHESVAGRLDRRVLDSVIVDRPVRVQHRSGALWILNTAALHAVGLDPGPEVDGVEREADGTPTGRLWRLDEWLRPRLPSESPPDLAATSARLLRCGVTGITDATPTNDPTTHQIFGRAVAQGDLVQRVVVTGGPGLAVCKEAGIEIGPVKVLFPDDRPLDLDAMIAAMRSARGQGRAVAVHAVTAAAAAVAIAAFRTVGPVVGDRLEHGAVIPFRMIEVLAELGIAVVTNPGFVATRGDQYLADIDDDERADLWRCRSLIDAGVAVGGGTDAPYGEPNPWFAIAAAIDRQTDAGVVLGTEEKVAAHRALQLFLTAPRAPGGEPRRVSKGESGDLCLLDVPLVRALRAPRDVAPRAVIVRGVLHRW